MISSQTRKVGFARTLKASSAVTADGQSSAVRIPDAPNAVAFVVDVTAAKVDGTDTLDIQIQTKLDGTNWVDVYGVTQLAGNGGAKRYYAKVSGGLVEGEFADATIAADGSVRDHLGDEWRVAWDITDGNDASFTFSVVAISM